MYKFYEFPEKYLILAENKSGQYSEEKWYREGKKINDVKNHKFYGEKLYIWCFHTYKNAPVRTFYNIVTQYDNKIKKIIKKWGKNYSKNLQVML